MLRPFLFEDSETVTQRTKTSMQTVRKRLTVRKIRRLRTFEPECSKAMELKVENGHFHASKTKETNVIVFR